MPDTPPPTKQSDSAAEPSKAEEDFLRVFLARRQQMEALVKRRVGCRATAADLIQDLFLRFWKRPARHQVQELDSYLLRSARNLAIDHVRGEQARHRSLDQLGAEPFSDASSMEHMLQAGDELQHVERALRALPERTRHIFLLNRIHGCTYADIARSMDLSQSAVEKHMMRALDACKASLEPHAASSGNDHP